MSADGSLEIRVGRVEAQLAVTIETIKAQDKKPRRPAGRRRARAQQDAGGERCG